VIPALKHRLAKRLKAIERQMPDAPVLHQLELIQGRINLTDRLKQLDSLSALDADSSTATEQEFVKIAARFSKRRLAVHGSDTIHAQAGSDHTDPCEGQLTMCI
jgi:hypothetical protein